MASDTLLIEIGTEELPPKSLNRLMQAFQAGVEAGFSDAQLGHGEVAAFATPRRLALLISDLADKQPDQTIERRGPAVKAAFDEEGAPTKALSGFMRSCGVEDPAVLETHATEKGEWLMFRSSAPGKALPELLETIINAALAALPIDKRMRWGSNRTEFVRPVQWIVCLYGDNIVPMTVLDKPADRVSSGHRFMGDKSFTISSANDYVEACREQKVLVSFEERRALIREAIEAIAAQEKAALELDSALLDEVTSLVEWPVALQGKFDEKFLAVPPEVLISAMKEHQRYFHLTDPETGGLLPTFITISNIISENPAVVITGNERVVTPRLSDAAFFFSQDTKTPLSNNVERLASVVFQTELGTYGAKTERISALAGFIAGQIGADPASASRAATLCKADLVSDMVGEFPDLQGVMGGYYARHDGEADEVVKGIEQHYRPTQAGGELPETPLASSVALADKLDTMVGLFGIKQPPTGSRDPFALRRQSLGVIRICIENDLSLDLDECLAESARVYNRNFATAEVKAYVLDRLVGYYADQGISKDIVEAATAVSDAGTRLAKIDRVIHAIHEFRQTAVAEQVIAANKRVANLLKKVDAGSLPGFNSDMAVEPAEQGLFDAISSIDVNAAQSASEKLETLATLQEPVDRFFDEVLVMDEDLAVQHNRLSLLSQLRDKFMLVADFSLLQ